MNTNKEYEEYFGQLATMLLKAPTDIDRYVKLAISAGLKQFWGSLNWSFKGGTYQLAIGEASDSYNLPNDFDSIRTLREESSNRGLKLNFMDKEQFDEWFPKQSSFANNNPIAYTVFYEENDKPVISLYPRPSSSTLYLAYYKTTPNDVSRIPDKFQSGVEACISAHFFPPGYNQRSVAYREAMAEIKRLEIQDKQDMSKYLEYREESSVMPVSGLMWWEY